MVPSYFTYSFNQFENFPFFRGLNHRLTSYSVSIGKIQEVILQEHLEKEDEVLVSLAGLKQVSV